VNRRTALSAVLSAVALWAAVTAPLYADAPPHPSAAATEAVAKVLTDAVARHDTPGVVGLVVDRSGVLFQGTAGNLDVGHGVPLAGDAIFNIASMTKPITSVAIMMLREQGKLQLDDPVSKYLPGFDDLKVITQFNPADGSY
jgi:CubicO group peptidase (beta-lactamase class C family)